MRGDSSNQAASRWTHSDGILAAHVATLKDGARVLIRALHRDDRELEARFLQSLSPRSRYLRHTTPLRRLNPDWDERLAIIATTQTWTGERIVGAARFVANEPHAELAIAVTDEWQSKGVGNALLKSLFSEARARGLTTLATMILPDNVAMLGLARAHGARIQFSSSDALIYAEFAF